MDIENKIKELTLNSLEERGFDDCYIYSTRIVANKIEVFLESDTSVTYEKCRKVSRDIEEYLDEIAWSNGKYTLEVSSPGVGSPLLYPRQYIKNVGRTIEVKYAEDQKVKGTLAKATETDIQVTFSERVKQGKKKVKMERVIDVPISSIREAKIRVSF